jgi:hypothetical protein
MSGKSDNPSTRRGNAFLGWLFTALVHVIFAGLAAVGILVINAAVRDWRAGEAGIGAVAVGGLFGIVMTAIGIGFFYVAYVGAPRFLGRLQSRRSKHRGTPWLENRQWRARRVVHSTRFAAWFMWFWCLVWWGILGLMWSTSKDLVLADRETWGQALPPAPLLAAGLAGLVVAVGMTWRRYRSDDAVLMIETLPGYLGERFRGKVLARLGRRLKDPVAITLTCGSLKKTRVRTGAGQSGQFGTVWGTDEIWSARRDLHPTGTTFDRGTVTLPINVELPADLPESGHLLDEPQIVWKLVITPGSALDRPVAGEFEIPVFARRDEA